MKRFLHRLSLLFVVLLLLTTAVFADFGPKPQLVVRVEQPPQEEYYLDLLDTGDWAKISMTWTSGSLTRRCWPRSARLFRQAGTPALHRVPRAHPSGAG